MATEKISCKTSQELKMEVSVAFPPRLTLVLAKSLNYMLQHLMSTSVNSIMAITIYPKKEQASGQFTAGAIKENKPIGFPHEGGELKPFSSLFYWAHAWSDQGGLIGEHPHQGFEIMSFVLKGEIEHYDSQLQSWKRLRAGDMQIIRSGKGISHAERFLPGAHIFQIWVDPDLRKTLNNPATYSDYRADSFPESKESGCVVRTLKGPGSPLTMNANIESIRELRFSEGHHRIEINNKNMLGIYVTEGFLSLNEEAVGQDDFVLIKEEKEISISNESVAGLFIIEVPDNPGYETYANMQGISAKI